MITENFSLCFFKYIEIKKIIEPRFRPRCTYSNQLGIKIDRRNNEINSKKKTRVVKFTIGT